MAKCTTMDNVLFKTVKLRSGLQSMVMVNMQDFVLGGLMWGFDCQPLWHITQDECSAFKARGSWNLINVRSGSANYVLLKFWFTKIQNGRLNIELIDERVNIKPEKHSVVALGSILGSLFRECKAGQ